MRGGRYTLYGCTVIPGFVPEIFEPADNFSLKKKYPDRIIDILRFSIGS
jgi:predicted cupin superfamily sugar epimerase